MNNIDILIVEDEPIISEDIADFLLEKGYTIAGNCYTKSEALAYLKHHNPDLVLMDINLGFGNEGIEIGDYLAKNKSLPFVYLTSYTDKATIDKAKHTYPMGYITKPIDFNSLFSTIEISLFNYSKMLLNKQLDLEKLNQGLLSPITNKEFEVLTGIYNGRNNKQMVEEHFVSINTIKTHIKNIYDKLDVHSRSELLAKVRQRMK